jgi:sulfofructose kinase
VDHHPQPDEKAVADSFTRCGGGPAANASVMVARMGLKAAFAGYLGTDPFGRFHMEELQAAGVNTELVARGPSPSPISSVWVKPSGERAILHYRSPDSVAPADPVECAQLHPGVILFDGHEPDLSVALLKKAHAWGSKTMLDAGSWNQGTAELFDKVDYLVCSERFAGDFDHPSSPETVLRKLRRHSRNVVITLGGNGLIWGNEDGEGRMPAFPVAVRDSTGAGDVFHGAFAGCIALEKPWQESLRYAAAAAALSCTRLGGRTGIPLGTDVESFLMEHPPRTS